MKRKKHKRIAPPHTDIKCITHLTLNTGHIRMSYPDDIVKDISFNMKRIIEDAQTEEGSELCNGVTVKLTIAGSVYIATLFYTFENVPCPLLITGGTRTPDTTLWNALNRPLPNGAPIENCKQPDGPYIVNRIVIPLLEAASEFIWMADFTMRLGWMLLSPHQNY